MEWETSKHDPIPLDREGDVVLVVGDPTGWDSPRHFLVSSKALSLASKVFATMISPVFKEGQQLREARSDGSNDRLTITLDEDDANAMDCLFLSQSAHADPTADHLTNQITRALTRLRYHVVKMHDRLRKKTTTRVSGHGWGSDRTECTSSCTEVRSRDGSSPRASVPRAHLYLDALDEAGIPPRLDSFEVLSINKALDMVNRGMNILAEHECGTSSNVSWGPPHCPVFMELDRLRAGVNRVQREIKGFVWPKVDKQPEDSEEEDDDVELLNPWTGEWETLPYES